MRLPEERTANKIHGFGIRARISLVFILLVALPFLLIMIWIYRAMCGNVVESYGANMADTMIAVSQQVSNLLDKYVEDTMNLYYNGIVERLDSEEGEDLLTDIKNNLDPLYMSNKYILAACLTWGDSEYTAGEAMSVSIQTLAENSEDVIREAGGKPCWFWADALAGKAGSQRYILARSLNSSSRKNVGTLYLVLSERFLARPLDMLETDNIRKYVLDADGRIIYSTDSDRKTGDTFELSSVVLGKKKFYGSVKDDSGSLILASSALMEHSIYFVSLCPVEDAMETFKGFRLAAVAGGLIYAIFLAVMLFLLNYDVFLPLHQLKSTIDAFACGNTDARMAEKSTGEIRSLIRHFNQMTEKLCSLMAANEKALMEKNRFQMKALTAQIKPHFIYNALNTIKWMAVINKQDNICEVTDALVGILMNAAKIEDEDYSLKEELLLLENYARIQKARFMNLELQMEVHLEPADYRIHKFLLQPIMENSIVHGFSKGKRQGLIRMQIWEDGKLHIRMEDNGVGFDVDKWKNGDYQQMDHTNIGLKNIEEIIRLEYGTDYGITIFSDENGTRVEYLLPLIRRRVPGRLEKENEDHNCG